MAQIDPLSAIQRQIWDARLPLEIRLASSESRIFDKTDPYLISCPRLSYLPALLPKVFKVFSQHFITDIENTSAESAYFTYDSVPLKWHLPVGLLYDIYVLSTQDFTSDADDPVLSHDRARPFKLTVHFQPPPPESNFNLINPSVAVVHDSFINSVKEADFLRSGTAKPIMSLSAADSKALWSSTQENDLPTYSRIFSSLLPSPGQMRHIPLRVFLPSSTPAPVEENPAASATAADTKEVQSLKTRATQQQAAQGQIRVLQTQISPYAAPNAPASASMLRSPSAGLAQPQTLGGALHAVLPGLFPSRRTPILAKPLLHGAALPMNAVLEDLTRKACYADGWVNVVISLNT